MPLHNKDTLSTRRSRTSGRYGRSRRFALWANSYMQVSIADDPDAPFRNKLMVTVNHYHYLRKRGLQSGDHIT